MGYLNTKHGKIKQHFLLLISGRYGKNNICKITIILDNEPDVVLLFTTRLSISPDSLEQLIRLRLVDSLMFAEMTSLFLHIFLLHFFSVSISFSEYCRFTFSIFSRLFVCFCHDASVCVCVSVCWALCSDDWRAQFCSPSEDWPSLSPQRGVSTDGLLDAKWTGSFSSLDATPENSSCLFLTPVFPLMMCGQAANVSKNKSEWFGQLRHCCYFTSV